MQGQLHSKAQVMQTYLNAQEPDRASSPLRKPHTSSVPTPAYDTQTPNYPHNPSIDDPTAAASKQYPGGSSPTAYTTHTPYQGAKTTPCFGGVSPIALYSGTSKAAAATTSNSSQLVQVKRNVWLPLALVQQANGDPDLALHLAAQDQSSTNLNDSNDGSPTAGKAWTPRTAPKPSLDDPFLSQQGVSQQENDSCSDSIRSSRASHERSAAYAPWAYSSQQMDSGGGTATGPRRHPRLQYDSSRMQSHFRSAMSLKPDSAADCTDAPSKVDPIIQPPSLFTDPNQGMGGPYTFSQTTASKQGSNYGFRSPTASLPIGGSNSAFVSPQCVMDNTSLFSYSVTTPEQTVHARPPAWFATPDTNPTHGWGAPPIPPPATFNPAAHYPELNPSAASLHMGGQANGWGGYLGMHDPQSGAGGYIGNPWQQAKAHLVMSQYAASPEANSPHSTMAAGMGANTPDDPLTGEFIGFV